MFLYQRRALHERFLRCIGTFRLAARVYIIVEIGVFLGILGCYRKLVGAWLQHILCLWRLLERLKCLTALVRHRRQTRHIIMLEVVLAELVKFAMTEAVRRRIAQLATAFQ